MISVAPIQLKGHCYVLLQGNWIHPIAHIRHELIWYPERGMTLHDQYMYRPYVQSVVTECSWIVALYGVSQVFVVDETGLWRHPDLQTYGASNEWITHAVMGIPSSVAALPLDGGRSFKKIIREYKKRVAKASKLYS